MVADVDVSDGVDDAVGAVDDEDVSIDGKSGVSISEIILFIIFCLSNSLSKSLSFVSLLS